MNGKIVVSGVSIILVVGVVIGTVGFVNQNKETETTVDHIQTQNKAVTALCQGADEKKLCTETLGPVNSDDPKAYIEAVVKTSMDKVIKAFNMSDRLTVEHGKKDENSGLKMALDDCKDLLQSAIQELDAAGVLVNKGDINHLVEKSAEVKNWLGAVIAYQQSCLEGFRTDGEKQVQSQLQAQSLDEVQKITGVALDVVTAVSDFLASLDLNLNLKPAGRRLLDLDSHGYPTWFSASDRKLLAAPVAEAAASAASITVVVAKDGSGQYKTITDAIKAYPKKHQGKYIIHVKAGVYNEHIIIDKKKPNIYMYGDGPTKTVITNNRNGKMGLRTMGTATFSVVADDFMAKDIGFENTAGSVGHQAVALRVQGDRAVIFQCAMHGYQDTLYAHAHRQFYKNCEISGTIDFIFGFSSTIIQTSKIIVRKPGPNQQNIIVADGTDQKNMPTGIVLHNCKIVAEPALEPVKTTVKTFLARPWKPFSRAIFLENEIPDFINPEGYTPWGPQSPNTQHSYFVEYGNVGPGANAANRVKWAKGLITKEEAQRWTVGPFLHASTWLPASRVPFVPGFVKA